MINENLYDEHIWQAFNARFNPDEEYLGQDKEINKKTPLVSVSVATYNHEHLIEECLDSILAQKTDFMYEILVGEDESQDNTREIVKKYAEKHPDKIRLFLRDAKMSHMHDENGNKIFSFNHKWLRMSARGKYIALCDGDDYWINDHKLQKQVNFLQSNPDFSLCFHNAKVVYSYSEKIHPFSNLEEGEYTKSDVFVRWIVPTSSTVFRSEPIRDYRHAFNKNFLFGDIIVFMTLADRGRIWYFDKVWSVYRKHRGSFLHKRFKEKENIRKIVVHHKQIIETFFGIFEKEEDESLSSIYFLMFRKTFRTNPIDSISSFIKSFYYSKTKFLDLFVDLCRKHLRKLNSKM